MAITKDEMITLLNEDLAIEYTAAIQYLQHHAMVQGNKYGQITGELKEHADEEMGHSVILANRITMLGGIPQAKTLEFVNTGTFKDMLELDLKEEETAVARYKERTRQALEMGEFGLAGDLQGILADEEEHQSDLEAILSE